MRVHDDANPWASAYRSKQGLPTKGTRNRPENRLNLLEKSVNLAGFAFFVNTIIRRSFFKFTISVKKRVQISRASHQGNQNQGLRAFLELIPTEKRLVAAILYWSIRWVCAKARNRFSPSEVKPRLSLSDESCDENDDVSSQLRGILACRKNRNIQRERNVSRGNA